MKNEDFHILTYSHKNKNPENKNNIMFINVSNYTAQL